MKTLESLSMKRFGLIITTSLLVLVSAGGGYFVASRRASSQESVAERERSLRSELMGTERPEERIAPPIGDELMDPEKTLPGFHRYDFNALRQVYDLAASCDPKRDQPVQSLELEKARTFASFLCGLTAALPAGFFDKPPYMHPTGRSYVALAASSGRPEFQAEAWLAAHQGKLHALERPGSGAVAAMNRDQLLALWKGAPIVLTPRHVLLFAHRSTAKGDAGEYLVYPRAMWDERLAAGRIDESVLTTLALLALGALVVLTGTLVWFSASRIREKRRERENQLFVVRALTHELRTPATSLGLTLESLRADFDQLPGQSQEAFLMLCEQVQRLNRVIAGTTRYLKAEEAKTSPADLKTLPSVKSFFEAVLEPYQDRIEVQDLPEDRAFAIDPYLLKVCVQNLVENALRHGKPTVRLNVSLRGGQLGVDVEDQGTLPTTNPSELSAKAAYGSTHGLGLGLHLVTKIVKDLGGSLTLNRFPATFSLRFKEAP